MSTLMYDTYTIFWRELKRYKKSRSGVLIRLIQLTELMAEFLKKYFRLQ